MKTTLKKISALLLALTMVFAMSATVFAAELEENDEAGVAGNWDNVDEERLQGDSINIKKEIIAYNPNASTVHAPVVTYTYTVTPATITNQTVTDETTDHESGVAVIAPVKAGPTTNLVVSGTATGQAGSATSAVGLLEFNNTSTWNTAAAGAANEYNINLNFENVSFTQPGVYRYQIAETISAATYAAVAMEDGGTNTLYLDVYVDGNLDIYGYVCLSANDSVTPSTAKLNGFVNGTTDGSDKYYTYDLEVSKQVENDTYGEGHAFPFTITFSNPENYTSTFTITETAATGSTGFNPAAASAPTWTGTAKVKEGAVITYTGIPAGVDVAVYETNDVTGVTYQVISKVNNTVEATDDSVATGVLSTTVNVNTTAIATTVAQAVEITNTLLLISPTGVVLRFGPYALMFAAGAVLLILALRRRSRNEED